MIDKFIENIDQQEYRGGYQYPNKQYLNTLFKDIKMLSFNCMYANITVDLYDNNMLYNYYINKDHIDKIKYFISNKDQLKINDIEKYQDIRTFVNSHYSKVYRNSTDNAYKIANYAYNIMKHLFQLNQDSILYIDTDVIYYKNNLIISDIDIEYNIEDIPYYIMLDNRKYIKVNRNYEIKPHGYSVNRQPLDEINKIKSEIREDKLKLLLL